MEKYVLYRHNIMKIDSMDTFLSIRGGFNNGQRDVYFVRMLGCNSDIAKEIVLIDEKMGKETLNKRLFYKRIDLLPKIVNPNDMQFYLQQYEKWKSEKIISLKNNDTIVFSKTLGNACTEVLNKYRLIKKNATESIEKNIIVKLLYWIDDILKDSLKDWDERKCYKIIADNVSKEQDYLFYYMLTLIGCDVLLMERSGDIEIADELKSISYALKTGNYSQISIPQYVPYSEQTIKEEIPKQNKKIQNVHNTLSSNEPVKVSVQPHKPVTVKIEPHPSRRKENIVQRTVVDTNVRQNTGDSDKSFEELAQLASSIVMITVYNRRGQPEATGSGIMIGREGFILTNNHVTAGGCFFTVQIEDDSNIYKTDRLIKSNSLLDLAIIRIEKRLNPLPLYRGTKKLVRGQKVIAIGSPLGLFNSVSDGIISGFRTIGEVDMIQFTAPISHGSSGGALINMQGQVIGISTAGFDEGQNINLAVSYENIYMFSKGFFRKAGCLE